MHAAKWRLTWLWSAGALAIALILIGQSYSGYYGTDTDQAWTWFLPTVMPTLSLIVAVLVSDYRPGAAAAPAATVDPRMLRFAFVLSALYLALIAGSILVQPFVSDVPPLALMQRSNLWLAPLQGLVAGVLGVFFQARR